MVLGALHLAHLVPTSGGLVVICHLQSLSHQQPLNQV